jgi:hypothetical protein
MESRNWRIENSSFYFPFSVTTFQFLQANFQTLSLNFPLLAFKKAAIFKEEKAYGNHR